MCFPIGSVYFVFHTFPYLLPQIKRRENQATDYVSDAKVGQKPPLFTYFRLHYGPKKQFKYRYLSRDSVFF